MHYSYIIYTGETKNIENKTIKTALPMMITLTYTDEKFIGIDKRKKKKEISRFVSQHFRCLYPLQGSS